MGLPVYSRDEKQVGKLERVLGDLASDVFDGIVIKTRSGERFVDARLVDEVYEHAVVLAVTREQAPDLPPPPKVPPVIRVTAEGTKPGSAQDGRLRRAWQRVFGRR